MLKSKKKVPFYKVNSLIEIAFDSNLLPQDFRNGHAYIFALPNSQQSLSSFFIRKYLNKRFIQKICKRVRVDLKYEGFPLQFFW